MGITRALRVTSLSISYCHVSPSLKKVTLRCFTFLGCISYISNVMCSVQENIAKKAVLVTATSTNASVSASMAYMKEGGGGAISL